jgi:hypothetical protein
MNWVFPIWFVSRKKGPSLLSRIGLKWGSSHTMSVLVSRLSSSSLWENNLEKVLVTIQYLVTFNEIEDRKIVLFENKKSCTL